LLPHRGHLIFSSSLRILCLNHILALLVKKPPPDITSPLDKGEKAEDEGLQKNSILNVF
jgi:hypothetical protein